MSTATVLNLAFTCLAFGSVFAYENAYDLLERRNRRLYDPRPFHSTNIYDEKNVFFPENRILYPGHMNSHFGPFGNGYDNLGNGIPVGRIRPFRQHFTNGWRFERRPFRERNLDDFGFTDYSHFTAAPRDFVGHRSNEYYYPRSHHRNLLSPGVAYGNEYRKGGAEVDRFVEENEGKEQRKTDEIYQRSHEGVKMGSSRKEKSGEEVRTDQVGENKSSVRSNKVVKKGRTTKGFAVHHHKDETGNSTTFFDESSDFGGQSDLRDFADGFGTKKTLEQAVDKGDEKYFSENGGQVGNYGSGFLAGNQRFQKDFSSVADQNESGGKFTGGSENDRFGLGKSYQYLNGEPFDYREPEADNYSR